MARVNLEDRFFAGKGLKYLVGYSGLSKAECIGYLALLWHTSQRERIYKCPREELLFLMELDQSFFEEEKCTKFIQALIKSGFVSQDGHIYTICGNKDQIEGLDKFVEKQRGNAQKRWNNPQGQSDVKEEVIKVEENASGMPVASQDYPKKCPTFNIQYSNSNSQDSISNVQGSSSNVQGSSSKVQLTVQTTEILSDVGDNSENREINKRSGSSLVVENISPTNKKNKIPEKWKSQISGDDRLLADMWLKHAQEMSTSKKVKLSQDEFALAVCKMRVDHGLRLDQIEHVLHFVSTDEFWRGKAISPVSLLKPSKSDPSIPKLEQVIRQIKTRKLSPIEKSLQVLNTTDFSIDIVEEILKGE